MRWPTVTWAVAWREIRGELRGRELVPSLGQFIVLALVIANFAFAPDLSRARDLGPGVLWMVLVFVGLVAFSRAFAGERERGSLEAMLLTPASHSAILAGKTLASALVLTVCELVLLPALAVFLGAPLTPIAFLTVFLAIIGMSALGALFAALASQTRARELLLPVLALPLWIPFVVMGSGIVRASLDGVFELQGTVALCYMDILFLLVAAVAAKFVLDD
ncbi:MAG TPA: heme exporter protein CcmB [Candidatus Dormibacteraeota bacterium]|jgi:heme exporter protein B|nr:heme exporter protein CcmB [Candidatus Dormibacteraeota bacterium]